MTRTTRPVLGAVSGLLFGLFVALNLQQWGVVSLSPLVLYGLMLLGLVLGLWVGRSAPLRRSDPTSADGPRPSDPADPADPEDPAVPTGA